MNVTSLRSAVGSLFAIGIATLLVSVSSLGEEPDPRHQSPGLNLPYPSIKIPEEYPGLVLVKPIYPPELGGGPDKLVSPPMRYLEGHMWAWRHTLSRCRRDGLDEITEKPTSATIFGKPSKFFFEGAEAGYRDIMKAIQEKIDAGATPEEIRTACREDDQMWNRRFYTPVDQTKEESGDD